ncbi:hypothetical protein KKB83_00495 [Patescibacteria group bacterium]|nr:hypothetical protein [Patescibacteria group bacterium]
MTSVQVEAKQNSWNQSITLRLRQSFLVDILCIAFLLLFNLFWRVPFVKVAKSIGVISGPLIPSAALLISQLTGVSADQLAVYLVALGQFFGVISFYFFLRELTGRRLPGLMVAFFYSLPVGFLALENTRFAFIMGDGAHVAALGLFPVTCYLLLSFLKRGRARFGLGASFGMSLVALISSFAVFNLFLLMVVILFSEIILGRVKVKLARFLFVSLMSFGLFSFWYTPGTLLSLISSGQGRMIVGLFGKLLPLSFFVAPVFLVIAYLVFESREGLQPIALAVFFLVIYLFLNLIEYLAYADVAKYVLLPHRFLPELAFSLAFFLGIAVTILLDAFSEFYPKGNYLLLESEMGGQTKRGISLLLLITIWLIGMALVYFLLPTDSILSEIKSIPANGITIERFWVGCHQLCFRYCSSRVDNLVAVGISLISFLSVIFLVGLASKKRLV